MTRDAALACTVGVCWGLSWPAVRLGLHELGPWAVRGTGYAAAVILLFAVIAATGVSPRVPRAHWPRLAMIGILSVAGFGMFSTFAQLTASTSRSIVLAYTMPIWAVLLSRLVLGEPIDSRRLAGLALGSAGLVALGWPAIRAGEVSIGLLFALLSGLAWAVGSVLLKRFPVAAPPLVITAWQIAIAAVVALAGMFVFEGVPTWPREPWTWAGIIYNVVIGQAFATTLWFTVLERMPAGIASVSSLLGPGIGVVGATLLLGERPTAPDWIGLVLIIAASATVLIPGGPAAPASRSPRCG